MKWLPWRKKSPQDTSHSASAPSSSKSSNVATGSSAPKTQGTPQSKSDFASVVASSTTKEEHLEQEGDQPFSPDSLLSPAYRLAYLF
jgi:hypothetical protein